MPGTVTFDPEAIASIIRRCRICRLAMYDDGVPYILPMNFGYRDNRLYFHSAMRSRKLDLLRRHPRVAFEFDIDHGLVEKEQACDWAHRYESVIGHGTARIIDAADDKLAALQIIVGQYADPLPPISVEALAGTAVFVVDISAVSGRSAHLRP